MSPKWEAVLLGGIDCGKVISIGVRAIMLKDGSVYEMTDEVDSKMRVIYRHSWKGVCS
jgi:hypothetical protein